MKYINCILLFWGLIIPIGVYCQTTGSSNVAIVLPTVALIDIEPRGNINLSFTPPTDAGRPVTAPQTNSSKWLNYTSAITTSGNSRIISASINQTIPGVDIKLVTNNAVSTGGGVLGVPSAQVILRTTPIIIVNGIRGAFTGSGTSKGHQLNFSLSTNNYANLSTNTNTTIVISYTISE